MKQTSPNIENFIRETVWEVTHIKAPSDNISLLDKSLNTNPLDFLYIFDILGKKWGILAIDVFETYDYAVMRMECPSKKLFDFLTAK